MSHTGDDPHGSTSNPARDYMDEMDRLQKSEQWKRCRDAGLTVEIFNRDFHGIGAWIQADKVEAMISNYELLINDDIKKAGP